MKRVCLITLLLLATGCMSTRVVLSPKWDRSQKPAYTDYFDYYWFGFVGHPTVNLTEVCLDQKPMAFQRARMADDIILSVITLGIYTPVTVRVWCGEP